MSYNEQTQTSEPGEPSYPTQSFVFAERSRQLVELESGLRQVFNVERQRIARADQLRRDIDALIGPLLAPQLAALQLEAAEDDKRLAALADEVRGEVRARAALWMRQRERVEAAGLRVQLVAGRVKWNDRGLVAAASQPAYAWLLQFREQAPDTVRISRADEPAGEPG